MQRLLNTLHAHLPLSLVFGNEGLKDTPFFSQALLSKQTSLRKHLILMCCFTMCESRQYGWGGGGGGKGKEGRSSGKESL